MPIEVEVPGLGIVEFPDGTPKSTMEQAIRSALVERQGQPQQAPPAREPALNVTGFGDPGFGTEFFPESPVGEFIGEQFALPQVIPGALAGAAAFTGPFAPVAIPAASFAGEAINQAVGITPRSNLQLGLAAALPAAGTLATGAGRIAARLGTRGAGARLLNLLGKEEATQLFTRLESPVAVNQLFASARASGSRIPMSKFLSAVDDVSNEVNKLSAGARKGLKPVMDRLTSLRDDINAGAGFIDPAKLQAELEALGDFTRSLARTGGQGERFAQKGMASLLESLDDAAEAASKNPSLAGAADLVAARNGFLRNETIKEAKEAIEAGFKVRRGLEGAGQFNPNQVIEKLQKNRFFTKAFSNSEQKEIFGLLKKINRIPVLPPPRGAQFGSGAFLGRQVQRAAGAGVGFQAGGLPGAVAGSALPEATRLAQDIALTLQFKEGRLLLGRLISGSDGAITPRIASLIGAFAASKINESTPMVGQFLGP